MINTFSRRRFLALSGIMGYMPAVWAHPDGRSAVSLSLPAHKHSDLPDLDWIAASLKKPDPLIWLFTGDSITQGAGATAGGRSYPEIFAERMRWEMRRTRDIVINTGISGNITDNILDDFRWRVGQFNPSVVSLMIGTNDCVRDAISTGYFRDRLELLIAQIRTLKAIPVLHTPNYVDIPHAPHCARLPEFIPVIRQVAENNALILVDNWAYWQNAFQDESKRTGEGKWLDDPVHPNYSGHVQIAQLLFKTLNIFDEKAPTCGAAKP